MTEDDFLEKLFSRLPGMPPQLAVPPGDDCAGFRIGPDLLLLAAVDQVVAGRHYGTGPGGPAPELVGRKLLARNLSDIAAMGGTARYCLVAAGFAPECGEEWLRRFFEGILGLAAEYKVAMIGGDLSSTLSESVSSLTILGEVRESIVLTRGGARPGDLLFATGAFGRSLATGHHLTFRPRCSEGAWIAERRFADAMIDVSDGLLLDAWRICRSSGTALRIDFEAVPRRTGETELREALTDGEDYELLFSVPAEKAAALEREWPFRETTISHIGVFVAAERSEVQGPDGIPIPMKGAGFDHFERPKNR
ncbi:MAG: thiamine-phosphate kinase [Syntrophales bacterium]|nr:thiamine-phosphate kinase [Syntrophales bacterium]MDD5233408.1 thiamine-phosphate kinase [Syntrophales bacterium]